MTGTLSPVPLAPEPGERDRLGEKHAAGLPDRWRGGRVNDEARIEPGSLLHLEGAPRTGTAWASTIPIIPGQGHLSGQRHELTPPRHETARLARERAPLARPGRAPLMDHLCQCTESRARAESQSPLRRVPASPCRCRVKTSPLAPSEV